MSDQPTNDELREWDCAHYWHAFTQMAEYEPFIIERADGCMIYDTNGRSYIDGASSMWCNVFGHRNPKIDQAVRDQLDKVAHVTSLGMSNPTTIRLARKLTQIAPAGLEHVFFSDDGATAVEVALKMAFQYWRQRTNPKPAKTKYISFAEAYHGDTLGSVSVSGVTRFQSMFKPLLFETCRLPSPQTYRLPQGATNETTCKLYLEQLEQLLRKEHEQIAALVIEPLVQCAAGIATQPQGYLRGVRELTRKYDVLLIADEVAVGMGRTGKMFACEQEQVVPDFLCLAKGLTGGYMPLAATLTHETIYGAFLGSYSESKTFFHGHTYGGNPLGAAAALATLELFDEKNERGDNPLAQLTPKVARLAEHLQRIAKHPNVGDVRQRGFIAGIELVKNKTTREPFDYVERRGWQVCERMLGHGVWLRPLGNVVPIIPPLSISMAELDKVCETLEKCLGEVF